MDPLLGQRLSHFRIDAKLGEGGMGAVYRATDERLRREVALKVLPDSVASDPERRRRFLREARAAAAVTHPNIASVFDIGEADGHAFIAMELVAGVTLRDRMARGLTHAESLRIAREISKALARAHDKGVVHRDLKPENVMITAEGDVKILDFGLAKLTDVTPNAEPVAGTANESTMSLTAAGRIMGTPPYMSPEQAEGRAEIDARSDVFSFGTMLFEMLAGVRPFRGETRFAVLYAVMHGEAEPLPPEVPKSVVGVVARCLRKKREERFASGGELLAALDAEAPLAVDAPSTKAVADPASILSGMGTALGATLPADVPRSINRTGPGGTARKRRFAPWIAVAVAAAAVATGGRWFWLEHRARAVTITDQPVPATSVPEARTEYVAGLQLLRDDAWGIAAEHFRRAAALDPNMAMAHLRLAMTTAYEAPERGRTELGAAMALRSQLDARDQGLMDALEPVLGRVHKDVALAGHRLEELSARYPRDVEVLDWLGTLDFMRRDLALLASRRASELDPLDGEAWQNLGSLAVVSGDPDAAWTAFERSASVATASVDGRGSQGLLDRWQGECERAEREFQQVTDLDPRGGLRNLASVKVALGRPAAGIRELLDQYVKSNPEAARPLESVVAEIDVAAAAGDFDTAGPLIEREAKILASSSEYAPHERLATMDVQMRLETGDIAGARRAAQDFTARSETWTRPGSLGGDSDLDRGPWLTAVAATGAEGLAATRSKWVDDRLRGGATPSLIWTLAWAAPASTKDEAKGALDALAEDKRLAPLLMIQGAFCVGMVDAYAGHVYLLADRPTEAIPYLRHATNACMGLDNPFEQLHAQLDLGLALEQTGDRAGACAAFGRVLERWGHARPKSVTADAARVHMTKLGCDVATPP
jgi:serine/threonine-protein kinase